MLGTFAHVRALLVDTLLRTMTIERHALVNVNTCVSSDVQVLASRKSRRGFDERNIDFVQSVALMTRTHEPIARIQIRAIVFAYETTIGFT